jgi:hypothetical protein
MTIYVVRPARWCERHWQAAGAMGVLWVVLAFTIITVAATLAQSVTCTVVGPDVMYCEDMGEYCNITIANITQANATAVTLQSCGDPTCGTLMAHPECITSVWIYLAVILCSGGGACIVYAYTFKTRPPGLVNSVPPRYDQIDTQHLVAPD